MAFEDLLMQSFAGNLVRDYATALVVLVLSVIALKIFKTVAIRELRKLIEKTETDFDDMLVSMISRIGLPFYLLVSLYISLNFIRSPPVIQSMILSGITILGTYYAAIILQSAIDYAAAKITHKRRHEEENADTAAIDLISRLSKVLLWVIAFFFVLTNLGFNITPAIAGLGIGGIAVAFALQNVLGDVFASFSIYFDRPFSKGDFITIGDDMGVVKQIGIKSTRIQTLEGQELIVSNRELMETRINNYKKMERRRVQFSFGVRYETPTQKLKKIPAIIGDITGKIKLATLDRAHFRKFGDYSLVFEVVYFIDSRDYNAYMDIQQEINFAIKERFEKEGIELAYPTQTIYVNKDK